MAPRFILLILFVTLFTGAQAQEAPVINEFLASNTTGITDEDGDFSDWIEIHNPNALALNLNGWHLTDDAADPGQWNFPAVSIPGNGYLIVFATDKKDKPNTPGSELHANFRLRSNGEYLALTRPDESVVQEFNPFPAQASDASYNASGFFIPTPGAANGAPLTDLPPLITSTTGGEIQPSAGNTIPITATVQALGGNAISNVTLHYRTGYGATNTSLMTNSSGVYTATIPAGASAGEMVRWYITANSVGGSSSRLPAFDDPIESAEYFGTVIASNTPESDLPILHWFVNNENASETRTGTQASLFFEGQFYDNVFCRIRGQTAETWPKHKFKFDFYRGGHFRWDADQPRVEEFNLQSFYREMFSVSNNTSYMREPLMFRYMQETGAASPGSKYLHVRRNKSFYGLFSFIEQVDEDFLQKHGYSGTGSLYKATWQNTGSPRNPATLAPGPFQDGQYRKSSPKDNSFTDLENFTNGIALNNPNRFTYVRDNVNLAQWINTIASMNVPFNHDQLTKNYYVYFEPETGEWQRFPWDADQSFPIDRYIEEENWANPLYGDQMHTQELVGNGATGNPDTRFGNIMHTAIMDNPDTRAMYLRRVKTLADQYLSENSSSTTLLADNATARYFVPTDPSLDNTWFTKEFDDSSWASGPQGFGYSNGSGNYDALINTRVRPNEVSSNSSTFYLRFPFSLTAEQAATPSNLNIRMKWDDGFVAYLNGQEIARNNVTPSNPSWNTITPGSRVGSLNNDYVDFEIEGATLAAANLTEGPNVLAIHAVNRAANNSDQLLQLELIFRGLPYFEAQVESIRAHIQDEADADRIEWAANGVNIGTIQNGINEILNTSLPTRRTALFETHADLLPDAAPSTPNITFGAIEYNPASGNQDEEFIQIQNNESVAIDISDWTISGGVTHSFIPGTVIPPNGSLYLSPNVLAFRNRATSPTGGEDHFVQGNFSGHISNFGEQLDLSNQNGLLVASTTTPNDPSEAQQFLVISEIMYHPKSNADDEFVELLNSSSDVTLDLTGVKFTAGIDYAFPAGTMLAPGQRFVVNFADFNNFSRLANGSDRITLEDSSNSTIKNFSYDDDLPWSPLADGQGPSLVLIHHSLDPSLPTSWRPSTADGGNPGSSDSSTFSGNPTADLDGDGLTALLEYALGLDDSVYNASPVQLSLTGNTAALTYPRNLAADDAVISIEFSSDLENWETIETTLINAVYSGASQIETTQTPLPTNGKGFYRLQILSWP